MKKSAFERWRWLYKRLSQVSLEELLQMRLWNAVRAPIWSWLGKPSNTGLAHLLPIADATKREHTRLFGDQHERCCRTADSIASLSLPIFGRTISFQGQVNWHWSPNAREWPRIPTWKLDYRNNGAGDPKFVWELNRLQFIVPLAKSYFLTGERRHAAKAVELVTSWLDANPPFIGVNWTSGIEMSLRQVAWLWTLRFLHGYEGMDAGFSAKLTNTMEWQAKYLETHLSRYSSANNHLVAELVGLVISGIMCGDTERVRKAKALLDETVYSQILEDGVGAEQSPNYLCHTIEYYLIAEVELRKIGDGLSKSTLTRLARSADFLRTILRENGGTPQWGDSDSGLILEFGTEYPHAKSLLNLLCALTDADSRQNDVSNDEKSFWLLGPERFNQLVISPECKTTVPDVFERGGYYMLRNDLNGHHIELMFDCGYLGMLPLAAHGHADALSILLYRDGRPVLVDSGTYDYMGSSSWRNYFRGTSAHNTVRVDELDQSDFVGPFLVGTYANACLRAWKPADSVSGRHDGYRRLRDPVIHERDVRLDTQRNLVAIEDRLLTRGDHLVEIFFHFDPAYRVQQIDSNACSAVCDAGQLVLRLDPRCALTIHNGDTSTPLGWLSAMYGEKVATSTVRGKLRVTGDTTLNSLIEV